jgi:2-oxoglutarate/2-oxoacid ferredoxin oxidoreductase subunit alpha
MPGDLGDRSDLSLVLCGEAGQGLATIELLLTRVLLRSGFCVCATKEYMSRVRGGSNSTQIRVASHLVEAPLDRIDLAVPLDEGALPHLADRLSPSTVVLADPERIKTSRPLVSLPFAALSLEAGGRIYENTAAAGALAGAMGADAAVLEESVRELFAKKGEKALAANLFVSAKAFMLGRGLAAEGKLPAPPSRPAGLAASPERLLLSGSDAFALGALAGGCDFLAAYPMTPSTGVMTFLAAQAGRFGIVVEQAEDEIAAANMALGAWYAGARALASTSGGGFALMVEALSLAGAIESPLVVHLAQRPGPATGLPTRTEQGDLLFALHAGHGEFPRALLAPGSTAQAFHLARHAFDLADRWQVPVFLLTDQNLNDTLCDLAPDALGGVQATKAFMRTAPGYRRYAYAAEGVSPRGIPGFGEGLVGVDSDEHDEEGHITESAAVRRAMVEKRLRKGEGLALEALAPEKLVWKGDAPEVVVACWGSTRAPLLEALESLGDPRIAGLHFPQVWPLPKEATALVRGAKVLAVAEGNAQGQFAQLISRVRNREADRLILRYDGSPFTADGLAAQIRELLP